MPRWVGLLYGVSGEEPWLWLFVCQPSWLLHSLFPASLHQYNLELHRKFISSAASPAGTTVGILFSSMLLLRAAPLVPQSHCTAIVHS